MYKLIAIDIDGTLLNDIHQVPEEVKITLREAKKQGVKIVLCSGRPIVGMRQYLDEVGLTDPEDYAIAYNGALILNTNSGDVVANNSLDYQDLIKLYGLSLQLDTPMHFFDIDYVYTPNTLISKYTVLESYMNDIPLKYCNIEDFPSDLPIPCVCFVNDPEKLSQAIENIPDYYKEKYAFVQSAPHFSEFTHPEATKGNAVKKLAEQLGIKREEVMTIGDNGNDFSMIEYAGLGVAMENAIPELKEIANYITLSNNEHGVAHVIQKFVLDKTRV